MDEFIIIVLASFSLGIVVGLAIMEAMRRTIIWMKEDEMS